MQEDEGSVYKLYSKCYYDVEMSMSASNVLELLLAADKLGVLTVTTQCCYERHSAVIWCRDVGERQ